MTLLLAPSARLPPVRSVHEHRVEYLENLVEYLRTIYNPPVRGIRRVDRQAKGISSGPAREDEDGLEMLRSDEFERAYTIRWLTGLVARASLIQDLNAEDGEASGESDGKVDALIREAASLLAVCAGTAAAGNVTRRFTFASPHLNSPVEVQLTDIPMSVDDNAATVGAHTWGSACLLAEMIVEDPDRFGLSQGVVSRGARVLELGAGTGLVSLAVAKLLSTKSAQTSTGSARSAVVATDYHPAVLANLAHNIKTNAFSDEDPLVSISPHALDWSDFAADRTGRSAIEPPFDLSFDSIFGADIIYEPTHASWIRNCVSALLRRPSQAGGSPDVLPFPRFHLLIPLRPTHLMEARTVEEVFPPASSHSGPGTDLHILEKENIVCEAGDARPGSEVEYVHYVIGWA
ncbi:hypothetical protein BV20DRAFT_1013044 [Pilatotrama ljubarskyi]|nr:hypothetical protein BV20DRAFT_1013044 [Pilatotrama ljubarskyi]